VVVVVVVVVVVGVVVVVVHVYQGINIGVGSLRRSQPRRLLLAWTALHVDVSCSLFYGDLSRTLAN
jgi:hypothetical protein